MKLPYTAIYTVVFSKAVLGNTGLLMAILGRAGQFADWSHLTEA
jgi:hypothetical protein